MGRRRTAIVAVGVGLAVCAGLVAGTALGAGAASPASIRLDDADNGRAIKARPGDRITVTIRNCYSCDYRWDVSEAPDPGVVAYRWADDQRAPAGSQAGTPEYRRFLFEAVGDGATAVTISYYPAASRPGHGRAESTYRLSFTVIPAAEAAATAAPAPPPAPAQPPPAAPAPPLVDPAPAPPLPVEAAAPPPAPADPATPPAAVPAAAPALPADGGQVLGPPAPEPALGPPIPVTPPYLASTLQPSAARTGGNRGLAIVGATFALAGLAVIAESRFKPKRPGS
jgi:predicted secreted protein